MLFNHHQQTHCLFVAGHFLIDPVFIFVFNILSFHLISFVRKFWREPKFDELVSFRKNETIDLDLMCRVAFLSSLIYIRMCAGRASFPTLWIFYHCNISLMYLIYWQVWIIFPSLSCAWSNNQSSLNFAYCLIQF